MAATDVVLPLGGDGARAPALQPVGVTHAVQQVQGVLVSFAGDLDAESAPVLAACLSVLSDRHVGAVTLDASRITFIDCAGLGVLLQAQARFDGYLWLRSASRPVLRLLDVLRLSDHLTCVPDPDAAHERPTCTAVDHATGLVMGAYGCTAEEAAARLTRTAQAHHVEVAVLAGLLVTVGTEVPAPVVGTTVDVAADVMGVMEPSAAGVRTMPSRRPRPEGPRSPTGYGGPG